MTATEKKKCQNCKVKFVIEPEDFAFYEKMKVPAPTWCPECRFQRRAAFRNERVLFHTKSAKTGKPMLALIAPEARTPVLTEEEWWADDWDATGYGRGYDFSRPFFEQFYDLFKEVPKYARASQKLVNSDYCANAGSSKDCYMVFNADYNEDCLYCVAINYCRTCVDDIHSNKSERCHGSFWVNSSYQAHFCAQCDDCTGVWLSKNCRGCTNCFGCVNLTKKDYHWFNEPLSKDEYEKRLADLKLHTWRGLTAAQKKAREFWMRFPNRYMQGTQNEDVTGEYITHSKNVKNSYFIREGENMKYVQYFEVPVNKDCYDCSLWGATSELMYEVMTCGDKAYNVKFSLECWPGAKDFEYCAYCSTSSDLFGCVGLRNKQYCILNKQYSEKEYHALRQKIIKHMSEMPYTDKIGRTYTYGEFFPVEFSPHAYTSTIANDHFPLSKEEAEKQGYNWTEPDKKEYETTIKAADLLDSIEEVDDDISKEVVQCGSCKKGYKIIKQELAFLKREGIPLPRHCFACRTQERLLLRNKSRLHHRKCQCAGKKSDKGVYQNDVEHFHKSENCPNEFETAYDPDRKEIVYCEECYRAEVA